MPPCSGVPEPGGGGVRGTETFVGWKVNPRRLAPYPSRPGKTAGTGG